MNKTMSKAIAKIFMNLIKELKEMSWTERIVVAILFMIPIPFTMEGYFAAKTIARKVMAVR